MRVQELSGAECDEVLTRSVLGRLACAHDNQPYIVPIHFSFDPSRRCLFAFSAVGQKVEWMRENPRVCVEVDDVTDNLHWTSVVAFGHYHELGESLADRAAKIVAQELFASRREWWLPAGAKVGSKEPEAVVLYQIRISRVTGRRASRDRQGG